VIVFLGLGIIASSTFADEKLPVLKVGKQTYSHVTVTEVSATNIYFISDQGLANAKLKDLDPALQKHFHYNPAAAAAAEQKHKLGNTQYRLRAAGANPPASVAEAQAEMDDAITRVKEIVNQPVRSVPRTEDMRPAMYSPGWFHPGAEKPDFNTVDVRTTQQFPYDNNEYVTSDLNPDVVFFGHGLEFNPMTKYFYTDRSVPKKRLTEEEMLEINRLYRIIAQNEEQLVKLQK
jgi:hypothetical protein